MLSATIEKEAEFHIIIRYDWQGFFSKIIYNEEKKKSIKQTKKTPTKPDFPRLEFALGSTCWSLLPV